MKLLVSTPAFGGQATIQYFESVNHCCLMAMSEGLLEKFEIHFQDNEALIHRARDRAADKFLRGDYDKLLTIDADIEFDYEDFRKIVLSPKDITGGLYPLKAFPVVMNFNPLPGKGDEFWKSHRGMDYDAFKKFRETYGDLVEVRHIATGFMCVTRRVFEKLRETSGTYSTWDASSGDFARFFHFYESGVHEGQLESEDWSFTRRAREAGFEAYIDTRITLGHVGRHTYRLGQFFGESQT